VARPAQLVESQIAIFLRRRSNAHEDDVDVLKGLNILACREASRRYAIANKILQARLVKWGDAF